MYTHIYMLLSDGRAAVSLRGERTHIYIDSPVF